MSQTILTEQMIEDFLQELRLQKKSEREIAEYRRTLNSLEETAQNRVLTNEILQCWKQEQQQKGIAAGTVTNRVVRVNHFLHFHHLDTLCFPNGGKRDLTGQQFGNLTALAATAHRASDRSICWRCRCNLCGREKEIPANQLTKGVQTSCGCERSTRLQKTNGYVDGTCLKRVFTEKINKNNTSGYKGVFQKRGKWAASIQYKKKTYYLGSYEKLEDAVRVRKLAEEKVREDAEKLLQDRNRAGE